jgi:hypothetical protein
MKWYPGTEELYKEGLHQRLLRIRLKIRVGSAKENY